MTAEEASVTFDAGRPFRTRDGREVLECTGIKQCRALAGMVGGQLHLWDATSGKHWDAFKPNLDLVNIDAPTTPPSPDWSKLDHLREAAVEAARQAIHELKYSEKHINRTSHELACAALDAAYPAIKAELAAKDARIGELEDKARWRLEKIDKLEEQIIQHCKDLEHTVAERDALLARVEKAERERDDLARANYDYCTQADSARADGREEALQAVRHGAFRYIGDDPYYTGFDAGIAKAIDLIRALASTPARSSTGEDDGRLLDDPTDPRHPDCTTAPDGEGGADEQAIQLFSAKRRFNKPLPKGDEDYYTHRQVGWIVPNEVAGLSDGLFKLERIEALARAGLAKPADPCLANRKPDEPSFTLLGRDPQAPGLVERWADDRETIEGKTEKVAGARRIADRMRAFKEGNPSLGMKMPADPPAMPGQRVSDEDLDTFISWCNGHPISSRVALDLRDARAALRGRPDGMAKAIEIVEGLLVLHKERFNSSPLERIYVEILTALREGGAR